MAYQGYVEETVRKTTARHSESTLRIVNAFFTTRRWLQFLCLSFGLERFEALRNHLPAPHIAPFSSIAAAPEQGEHQKNRAGPC